MYYSDFHRGDMCVVGWMVISYLNLVGKIKAEWKINIQAA
jgi:hypothetical protein